MKDVFAGEQLEPGDEVVYTGSDSWHSRPGVKYAVVKVSDSNPKEVVVWTQGQPHGTGALMKRAELKKTGRKVPLPVAPKPKLSYDEWLRKVAKILVQAPSDVERDRGDEPQDAWSSGSTPEEYAQNVQDEE